MTNKISKAELDRFTDLMHADPRSALTLLPSYDAQFAGDPNFEFNRGSFLVDIGGDLGELEIIRTGVESLENWLKRVPKKLRPRHSYNLANGHYALYWLARAQPGFEYDPVSTSLIAAKVHYREALAGRKWLSKDVLARLHVNYGNCLSGLGRTLEAIRQHDAALDYVPDQPMALGNLGVELGYFSSISRDFTVLEEALCYLDKALTSNDLEEIGGMKARRDFELARERIQQKVTSLRARGRLQRIVRRAEVRPECRSYAAFCRTHDLLLDFATRHGQLGSTSEDRLFFSMVVPVGDNATYARLSRIVNEIKERYVSARLVLYEACHHPYDLRQYDEMTFYGDNDDRAVYGIRPAKLKFAFESAYNIFDKIALFLRDYFNLPIAESEVDFVTIWKEADASVLRDPIARTRNRRLFALYDISCDLSPSGYLSRLRRLRNFLTHRYVVIHSAGQQFWRRDIDKADYHISYRAFAEATIELMRLVRYAVTYLVSFLYLEYRLKLRAYP